MDVKMVITVPVVSPRINTNFIKLSYFMYLFLPFLIPWLMQFSNVLLGQSWAYHYIRSRRWYRRQQLDWNKRCWPAMGTWNSWDSPNTSTEWSAFTYCLTSWWTNSNRYRSILLSFNWILTVIYLGDKLLLF